MGKLATIIGLCGVVVVGLGLAIDSANAAGGTVSGTVKFDGPAPKPKQLNVSKDKEVCGVKPYFEEDIVVGSDGAIKNAVVVIKDAKGDLKPGDVTFDQNGCRYLPHVLALEAGSTVVITNSDGILHNIHTYSKANPAVNMAQPKFKKLIRQKVDKPEVIKVTCDAHPWMHAWWYVTDTPYFAVTDEKGSFTIKDVPPGNYTVEVWQEKLGVNDQKVEVKDGQTATANFTMK